jgi:hypothetical protein
LRCVSFLPPVQAMCGGQQTTVEGQPIEITQLTRQLQLATLDKGVKPYSKLGQEAFDLVQ